MDSFSEAPMNSENAGNLRKQHVTSLKTALVDQKEHIENLEAELM